MIPRGRICCIALVACGVGCNELSGLSSLDKVDCVAGACAGGGGNAQGGGGANTQGGGGGNAPGGAGSIAQPLGLSVGRHGGCVISEADGLMRCWGLMPGDGSTTVSTRPVVVDEIQATSVGHGYGHRCARDVVNDLWCWGNNDFGQLGDGTLVTRLSPIKVTGLSEVTKVSLGAYHTCAETASEHYCWGNNAYGQLGTGDTADRNVPTPMSLPTTTHFGTGAFHGCAVLESPEVMCWGRNDRGQLGMDPTVTPVALTPVLLTGLPPMERVYPGVGTTCLRTTNVRELHCWGANDFGQLGDGTTNPSLAPVHVAGITRLGVLYPGLRHTCASDTSDGENLRGFCWGANDFGQLGLPAATPMFLSPQPVNEQTIQDMAAKTSEHTCITMAGEVLCAGLNDTGQLGDGTAEDRDTFTPVAF